MAEALVSPQFLRDWDIMILREFLYLDDSKLEQYLSQVEGGLRSASTTSTKSGSSSTGKLDLRVASGELGGTSAVEDTTSRVDTSGSRFDRLMSLIAGHHDEVGWLEVISDADLTGVAVRNMVELDVELTGGDELDMLRPGGLLTQFTALAGAASALGAGGRGDLPSEGQLDALLAIGAQMNGRLMRGIALSDETTTVYGMLRDIGEPRALEGDARVVGKVKSLVAPGSWAMSPNMPMLSTLPREQRRELARKGPADEKAAKFWIRGPAIELDVLAIWN